MITSVFQATLNCLLANDLDQKTNLTNECWVTWHDNHFSLDPVPVSRILIPGRPANPELVWPRDLPKRRLHTLEGRAALLHAIAHIEFNAINLALDAVYRFQDMPKEYYDDWLRIAQEEAKHFALLRAYLNDLGFEYGDFKAHNGLWELALETDYDILARMALVPRIMEARGLDVTPGIIAKFASIQDKRAIEILSLIVQEEEFHVAAGNKWFHYLCQQRNLDPLETFKGLIAKHINGQVKPPFAKEARLKSGFTLEELELLESL